MLGPLASFASKVIVTLWPAELTSTGFGVAIKALITGGASSKLPAERVMVKVVASLTVREWFKRSVSKTLHEYRPG